MTSQNGSLQVLLVAPSDAGAGGGQAKFGRLLLDARYTRLRMHHVKVPHRSHRRPAGRVADSIRMSAAAVRLVRRHHIQVVHIFTPGNRTGLYEKLWLMLLCRLSGASTVFNFRGEFNLSFERLTPLERALVRVALRRSTVVLCQYQRLADYVKAHGLAREPDAVRVLPNAIDPEELRANRRAPSTPGREIRLLFMGAAIPQKGLDVLLRALDELSQNWPDARWRLDVYGVGHPTGPDRAILSSSTATVRGRVHFHGHVRSDARRGAFEFADVCVLPSRTEGFPNVLLEALAAGIAVVAADAGAVREIIRDGHDGLLVPTDDAPALATALHRVIDDPSLRMRLSEAATQTVGRYTMESVADQFESLYLSIVGANP